MKRQTFNTLMIIIPVLLLTGAINIGPFSVASAGCNAEHNQTTTEQPAATAGMDQLSQLFRKVAKAVSPAVVEVQVTEWVQAPQMPDLRQFFGNDFPFEFRMVPPPQESRPRARRGLGSGVVIDAKDGYILTNDHVVGGADRVVVVLPDGRKFEAEWVHSDPYTDIAVIKIQADGLIAAPLGDSDKMDVGDWVLAIGSPRGLPQTVTAGIISAKDRTQGPNPLQRYLQTDASINHGNSGGPLVNMQGEVIGINNAIVTTGGGNEGIGFAIPSNSAKMIMDQLIEKGEVVRGYLGIQPQDVDQRLAESFNLPSSSGALVAYVEKDSPAEKAGLKEGDFIVSINGTPIDNQTKLREVVAVLPPDSQIEVEYYRQGELKSTMVTITHRPETASTRQDDHKLDEAPRRYGLTVSTLDAELAQRMGFRDSIKGVVITEVAEDSDAAEQGLSAGMIITHVDGVAVSDIHEFAEALARAGDGVRLRVGAPSGGWRYILIQPRPVRN